MVAAHNIVYTHIKTIAMVGYSGAVSAGYVAVVQLFGHTVSGIWDGAIVIVTAVLLTLASIFYLSFSVATRYYDGKAAELKDPIAQLDYKDSVKYLGVYSYQKCLETQIGLGLDLKGGMNVILEISVPDVIVTLADHKTDAAFTKSLEQAKAEEETSQSDFISLFIKYYKQNSK